MAAASGAMPHDWAGSSLQHAPGNVRRRDRPCCVLDSILFEDEAEVESLPRGSYESVLRGFGTAWPGSRVVVSGGPSSSEDVLLLQLVRVSPMPVAVLDLR